jgi:hypothetical protein
MKTRRPSVLLAVLALGAVASHAATLELDEQNGTITATFDGNPITITLTGPKDGWTIQLPNTFSLNGPPAYDVLVGEPETPSSGFAPHNEILVGTAPQFLTWNSDLPSSSAYEGSRPTTATINDAGSTMSGIGTTGGGLGAGKAVVFDLVLSDKGDSPTGVPDAAATLPLLGLSLAGLGILRKFQITPYCK